MCGARSRAVPVSLLPPLSLCRCRSSDACDAATLVLSLCLSSVASFAPFSLVTKIPRHTRSLPSTSVSLPSLPSLPPSSFSCSSSLPHSLSIPRTDPAFPWLRRSPSREPSWSGSSMRDQRGRRGKEEADTAASGQEPIKGITRVLLESRSIRRRSQQPGHTFHDSLRH